MTTLNKPGKLEALTDNALYFEYTKAADPIGSGTISKVPYAEFGSELHESGKSRVIPLDLSSQLNCAGPATSPALCANFVRILANEDIATNFNATSQLVYVIKGSGRTAFDGTDIPWKTGDFFVLPGR